MPRVLFREERCKSCGLCIPVCPVKIIDFADRINIRGYRPAGIKEELQIKCVGCASCAKMCPDRCITVTKDGGNKK